MLTDIAIKKLEPPAKGQKTYRDDVVTGFGVRVSQGGAKSFVLTYGKNRQMVTIGRVGVIKLTDARAEAKRILAEHTLGKQRPKTTTFADALPKFLDDQYRSKRDSSRAMTEGVLARHFLPGFKNLNLTDIGPEDIKRRLDRLDKLPSAQLHAFVAIRTFMRWSVRQRFIPSSPVEPLSAPSKAVSRERVLTDGELRAIVKAAKGTFGHIAQLLYLTAQRRSQVAELQWKWISNEAITWPADDMKGDREHLLPITPFSAAILAQVPRLSDEWVFPSKTLETPFSGYSKGKKALDMSIGVEY